MRTALLLTLVVVAPLSAADWPAFRGPAGAAVSPETNLPTGFTPTSGLRWKVTLPGRGLASPVIVGNKVYITCSSGNRDDRLHVLAYDASTGAELWHRQLTATGSTNAHPDTCMAAPTPVADATGVYALFASGDLAAFTPEGTLRWYRSLVGDYPTVTNQIGMASSPVMAGGKLIVPMDNAGESFLAALDPATGKNVWKVERPRDINWVTPLVRTADGKDQVLFNGPKDLVAYDAETGKKLWASKAAGGGSIPSSTLMGDQLIMPISGVTAFKLGADGPTEVWKGPKYQTRMTSPLVYQGKLYAVNPTGFVTCADAKTGEQIWQERAKGPFSSSPVAGDGKIYIVNEKGLLTVMKAGDTPEVLSESNTNERGQATPAISGGALFLRGDKSLFCIGDKLGG